MIDLKDEDVMILDAVAAEVPATRAGKRIHPCTIRRWATGGVRGCVLETVQVGGRRYTSKRALTRFLSELTEARRTASTG